MSTLKVNTIQNTSGVEVYTCKAWVNFNGTGTVAIRASGNVSSITDNGTGRYAVNFTNAFSDANYSVVGLVGTTAINRPVTTLGTGIYNRSQTTTSSSIFCVDATDAAGYDADLVCVSFFR